MSEHHDHTTGQHALYRFYDTHGQLLYVGITINPSQRWKKHAHDKPWWHDVADIRIETHPTRQAVLDAERAAIIAEKPQHNVVHNRRARPPVLRREPAGQIRPARPPITAADMPDDCHDHCVRHHLAGIYYPYRWEDGIAYYRCVNGHRWTCHWGWDHKERGRAPEHYGHAVELYNLTRASA